MELVTIQPERIGQPDYAAELYEHLEMGNILLLPKTPFAPAEDDAAFLRGQHQAETKIHKNIAYKTPLDKLTGAQSETLEDAQRLKRIMKAYAQGALQFLANLLPAYAKAWKVDYATFRPFEEQGRDLPLSRRNDLMHVDAFPTRPTHGGRILRLFTNISPDRDRVWVTAGPFDQLAQRYAKEAGLDKVTGLTATLQRTGAYVTRLVGVRSDVPSPYDQFMMGFHHFLKANENFQKNERLFTFHFPPGSSWICFTDQIAHAVISGQYALEQTCIVPRSAMQHPELAPVAVLERLAGKTLAPSA